ncbi:MAG: response regulator transcription factor [Syntrophomonadaceae bacterium]|jgi:DNA-binding NarL/FixJ family response regulator|nr:response regulator transcription factor [Syntrophomonadaceae bacterium]
MDLIHVTKDGIVTGDYWGGIRQVEKDKVKQAIKYREQKQREEYFNAIQAAKSTIEPPTGKINGRRKRKSSKKTKPTMREIYGEQIERLFVDGFTMKQIASTIGISTQTVSKIIVQMKKEAM